MSCNKCGCNSNPCCCASNVPSIMSGAQGPQGVPGIQGNPGLIGPTGPAGEGANPAYGQVYSTTTQTVSSTFPVVWDGIQNEINGSVIATTALRVTKPGRYQITWAITYAPLPT